VWRGFRGPTIDIEQFFVRLNTVFVPATVEMQVNVGLDGYIPTVPDGLEGKPDAVPDETAILFWDSQQTYENGFNTLAVRTYTLTHGDVYTAGSRADFPVPFAGTVVAGQPYYLVPQPADWMKGQVQHLVGGRPGGQAPEQFLADLATALTAIQSRGGLAGAIACAADDYLVYWELASGASEGGSESIASLAKLTGWNHIATAQPTTLDKGLWDPWPGMNIASGDSLNMQFKRRWENNNEGEIA
jgi:hypothetical protein